MSEREAFDARNILKVRGNSLLPAPSNTAALETSRPVLTASLMSIPDAITHGDLEVFFYRPDEKLPVNSPDINTSTPKRTFHDKKTQFFLHFIGATFDYSKNCKKM